MTLWALAGCGSPKYASPYQSYYESALESVRLPGFQEISKCGIHQLFRERDLDTVWTACLQIATQYQGVLKVDSATATERRLLFIHGVEQRINRTFQWQNTGGPDIVNRFLDIWIVVGVRRGKNGTDVYVAWLSPTGAQVVPFPSQDLQGSKDRKDDIARWDAESRHVATIFRDHLCAQLDGVGEWERKYRVDMLPSEASRATGTRVRKQRKLTATPAYQELELGLGNANSARIRRTYPVLDCPELLRTLTRITEDLKRAAEQEPRRTRVFVIAQSERQAAPPARACANGDIFVTSRLLDHLTDVQELAAVLAHELDHLFQHDVLDYRLRQLKGQAVFAGVAVIGLGGAAGCLAYAVGATVAEQGVAVLWSSRPVWPTSLGLMYLGITTGGIAGGLGLGHGAGTAMSTDYARHQEFDADYNSIRYLHAAGYEPNAVVRVLQRMKTYRGE